ARMQVLEEARHVDALDRPQTHGHGRELPEVGHQPGMRIGRYALAVHFATEVEELFLRQPAFEEGARIDAGRGVALEVDQIAAVPFMRRMPEMVEADAEQRAHRGEAGDV